MDFTKDIYRCKISCLECSDVRFPTSQEQDAPSDAMHPDGCYACAYVVISLDNSDIKGNGMTFTIGNGQELVVAAVGSLTFLVQGKRLEDIFANFATFWRSLTSNSQLRWVGPERGVIHLATAAIINSLWDLWAKIERKPLWKLLVDMDPEFLLSTIDFRYMSDALTKEEALAILRKNEPTKAEREIEIMRDGLPAYITSVGWLDIPTGRLTYLCEKAVSEGWTRIKLKVGRSVEDDKRRAAIVRKILGDTGSLMTDVNQMWDVDEAIDWMRELAEYRPLWIEEPTSPDDVIGHGKVSKALQPYGIGVATGEHCSNRVIFKQLLQSGAIQFCQIDACRLGGVNEVLAVLLMAAKFGVPVCPHSGGVGLCEMVQHLSTFNYISVAPTWENVQVEFADHCHQHFVHPVKISGGKYMVPQDIGYSVDLKDGVIEEYLFPDGPVWRQISQNDLMCT